MHQAGILRGAAYSWRSLSLTCCAALRCLHRACSTSSHPSPTPPKLRTSPATTYLALSSSFSASFTTSNNHPLIPFRANIPFPHALYLPVHPSTSTIPACPCPTLRPVTRPPPDSPPRPRYPYNPSRASAPSVNHLPSLSVARRHCASFIAAVHFLSTIPSIEPSIQRLRVHSSSSSNQPSRHHSTLHQTIDEPPPMRALKSPNLWRLL